MKKKTRQLIASPLTIEIGISSNYGLPQHRNPDVHTGLITCPRVLQRIKSRARFSAISLPLIDTLPYSSFGDR